MPTRKRQPSVQAQAMPRVATAEELLGIGQEHLADQTITLPSGLNVTIRTLSRRDMLAVARAGAAAVEAAPDGSEGEVYEETIEVEAICRGMVEPALTAEQVAAWRNRAGSADDFAALHSAIVARGRARKADAHAVYKSPRG